MPPFVLLSFFLGAAYGTAFHLWRGKNIHDLIIYSLTGFLGFLLGQGFGNWLGINLFMIGPLHVIEATLTSWGSLFLIQWLKVSR